MVTTTGQDAGRPHGDLDDPVLNGPYDPPQRHFEVTRSGPTGRVLIGRRRSESWVPVPASRKGRTSAPVQESLDFDLTGERIEPNSLINDVRRAVETWRLSYAGVTPITRKLLQHWSDPARGRTGCSSASGRRPRRRSSSPRSPGEDAGPALTGAAASMR